MHNYWLGIMAAAFALAMVVWIALVFNADRHPRSREQDSEPHREVIGGEFEARAGGRQLMPHPGQPGDGEGGPAARQPGGGVAVPEQGRRDATGQDRQLAAGQAGAMLPEQGGAPSGEQAPARADAS